MLTYLSDGQRASETPRPSTGTASLPSDLQTQVVYHRFQRLQVRLASSAPVPFWTGVVKRVALRRQALALPRGWSPAAG